MDSNADLPRWTRHPAARYALIGLAFFPVVSGLMALLSSHFPFGMDINAIICAAVRVKAGESPYNQHLTCPGIHATAFVYAPQLAVIVGIGLNIVKPAALHNIYALVLWLPSCAFLLWYATIKVLPGVSAVYRLLGIAGLLSMTFYSGNIGLIIHAGIILSSLCFAKTRWPFLIAVLLAVLIKPVFMSYCVLLLLEDRPLLMRLKWFFGMCGTCVVAFLTESLLAGPFADDWRQAISEVVLKQQPGLSFFGLMHLLGVAPSSPLSLISGFLFLLTVILCGLTITRWSALATEERVLLGLGLSQLLNPRINDYDLVILVPYTAFVLKQISCLGDRRLSAAASWGFVALMSLCILTSVMGFSHFSRIKVSIFAYYALTFMLALATVWKRRQDIATVFKRRFSLKPT